ncbi:MAG: glycosyltransferase family 2 protein [Kiritimatiellae bacterium]|nr:glycosyltransferase family 2 protein [Kiritimatiellia bacterium]
MKLVVQIPALNEERTIGEVIARIPRRMDGVDAVEIVVVDDGSTDRTAEIAVAAGAHVIRHDVPRGVGAAFRDGLEASIARGADVIVTIDADGQFNPEDIPRLAAPILRGEADFATASRFADPALEPEMPRVKRWGNAMMARWISRLTGRVFHDVSCGFRAYGPNAFLRLVLTGDFTYTHETFLALAFAGLRMVEVPVRVRGVREFGASRVASNLWRYGWRTASIILRTYRDYRPLRFFGWLAAWPAGVACALLVFLVGWRLYSGGFSPHKWAGFVAAALGGAALLVFLIGVVADMLDRIRAGQDELLYRLRRLERALHRSREQHRTP